MDMKRILQALDNASSRKVEGADDMRCFVSTVRALNQSLSEQVQDMGNGVRKKTNPDGSYEISDGGGTKHYDAQGKLTKTVSPSFAGVQNTSNADGSSSSSYQQGPLSIQQKKDASGNVTDTDSEYQLGANKLRQQQTKKSLKDYIQINELLDKPIHRRAELGKIVRAVIASGNTEAWDQLDAEEKFYGLDDNGLVPDTASSWEWKDANRSDKVLFNAIRQRQDNKYQIDIGPEKRDELKSKAEELAEIKRQQLRKESLQDAEIAFQRAETVAQREAEMEKIKRKFEHDLKVINTEHSNNMEAIRTGNSHEINKMDKEHQHEKDKWDREDARDQTKYDREKENKPSNTSSNAPDVPEPEEPKVDNDNKDDYEEFKADLFKLSGLPAPEKQDNEKPSKYNTDDAVDVDFRDVPDDKDDNKPEIPQLPAPKKEDMAYFRNLIANFDKPKSSR